MIHTLSVKSPRTVRCVTQGFLIALAMLAFCALMLPSSLSAQVKGCGNCHYKLKKGKVVHPAIEMGCPTCHVGIDINKVPHKVVGKFPKGLFDDQPTLCYKCHDKAKFTNKNVHPALSMGCTACHNPHSSPNPRMLIAAVPDLCLNCHDKGAFGKKVVHAALDMGCLTCHDPHSTNNMALLKKQPIEVCMECHPDKAEKHVIADMEHAVGAQKDLAKKSVMDPSRPDKAFYCGSCHEPHSSEGGHLLKFNAKAAMDLCENCHK